MITFVLVVVALIVGVGLGVWYEGKNLPPPPEPEVRYITTDHLDEDEFRYRVYTKRFKVLTNDSREASIAIQRAREEDIDVSFIRDGKEVTLA